MIQLATKKEARELIKKNTNMYGTCKVQTEISECNEVILNIFHCDEYIDWLCMFVGEDFEEKQIKNKERELSVWAKKYFIYKHDEN